MAETTDIEKKSLEAHVELCAERYRFLEDKLEGLENKISAINTVVHEVHDMMQEIRNSRNNQLINWGIGIIGSLVVFVGFLLERFVLK
jgi:prefoldin subunit 5